MVALSDQLSKAEHTQCLAGLLRPAQVGDMVWMHVGLANMTNLPSRLYQRHSPSSKLDLTCIYAKYSHELSEPPKSSTQLHQTVSELSRVLT